MPIFRIARLIQRVWQRDVPARPTAYARCPHCAAALRPTDSLCPQCGARRSSAGIVTRPLTPPAPGLQQWATAGAYVVCVFGIQDRIVRPASGARATPERSVCIEVGYTNRTTRVQKHRCSQWLLTDTEGYRYTMRMESYMYQELQARRLPEGWLSPGRQVRGWVAFGFPESAVIDYVQFMTGYLDGHVVDFVLPREE